MTTKPYNLALVGFGNVGKAFVRLLHTKRELLREQHDIEFRITGVASRRLGWRVSAGGFDLDALCEGRFQSSEAPETSGSETSGTSVLETSETSVLETSETFLHSWLASAHSDVLFECSSLNRETGEPAAEHIRAALNHGAHAISANKGPVVFHLDELRRLSAEKGRRFLFESSVMDGIPIFSMFRECLPALELRGFRGVLNSTTNVILCGMERGLSFEESLAEAQKAGVAETDPSDDIDGWDAAVKTVALANVLMGARLRPSDVSRTGIRELTAEKVQAARRAGSAYKLVCRAERRGGMVSASVQPELVPLSDPIALVEGTSSIVSFETDMFPGLVLTEENPGLEATAYGLLADFITAVRN